jgi:hypothetical protein
LATTSNAPAASALTVIRAPFLVNALTMTTGIGRCAIRRRRNSTPSMCGISTSSVRIVGVELQDTIAYLEGVTRRANDLDVGVAIQASRQHIAHDR